MIEKIIEKIKAEPVRARIYAIAVVIATYLLARGYVQATDADFLISIVGLVLGVERSRAKVSPVDPDA